MTPLRWVARWTEQGTGIKKEDTFSSPPDPRGTWDEVIPLYPLAESVTLRDYFAAAALQSMHGGAAEIFTASLVRPEKVPPGDHRAYIEKRITELVGACYAIADAMMVERRVMQKEESWPTTST